MSKYIVDIYGEIEGAYEIIEKYQEPSNDCISRTEAIEGLGEEPYVWNGGECEIQEHYDWKQHKEMLENLPPVTSQEPKTVFIPKGATNGDVIKAMFPLVEVKEKNNGYEVYFGIGTASQYFNHQWWNAPFESEEP